MIKRSIFILISCFTITQGYGKTAEEVLDKITKIYTKSISMKLDFNYYEDVKSPEPIKSIKGEIKYLGDVYFSKVDDLITLHNNNYIVMVDLSDKIVMLDKKPEESKPNSSVDINSMAKNAVNLKLSNNSLVIEYGSNQQLAQAELFYNKTTFLVSKIIITYKPIRNEKNIVVTPQLVINYSDISTQVYESDPAFTESNYVKQVNNKWLLVGDYKEFEFINHLDN